MRTLEDIRVDISALDNQLVEIFEKRMRLASEVAEYKKANNLPVFDAAREAEVLAKVTGHLKDQAMKEYCTEFFKALMAVSKKYQSVK